MFMSHCQLLQFFPTLQWNFIPILYKLFLRNAFLGDHPDSGPRDADRMLYSMNINVKSVFWHASGFSFSEKMDFIFGLLSHAFHLSALII